MNTVFEGAHLDLGWRGRTVLHRVDLRVARGERLALLGENGCGKTTLLRALAGLDRPLRGTLRWEGKPLPRGPERVRTVGVLLQNEVRSALTVRELVTLGLALDGPPGAAARRAVDAILTWMALQPLAERSCLTLSGGEAQRALLARALVARPRLLLLDEPTNHLDPAGCASLLFWLQKLRGEVAVVVATHDLALAAHCDRVALLHAGAVDCVGAAKLVLTPENLARTMGVQVCCHDDPAGGPPWIRVLASCCPEQAPGELVA